MTFEKYFVAIRHESELMTPLVESPLMNFSLREIGYLGVFGLSAVFAAIGSIPSFSIIFTFPLLVLALFRWHGEIPEMYLYFMVMPFFEPSKKKRRKAKHPRSEVSGYGERMPITGEQAVRERIQKVRFSDEMTPLDMTLEIGGSHIHERVSVFIDDRKIVCDSTNGAGQIVVSVMPQRGQRRLSIRDSDGHILISKTVQFEGAGRQ